jgi:hypothetical protein
MRALAASDADSATMSELNDELILAARQPGCPGFVAVSVIGWDPKGDAEWIADCRKRGYTMVQTTRHESAVGLREWLDFSERRPPQPHKAAQPTLFGDPG